ncbi:MAG: peptidase domain-containing ABC transporter [Bacteroides sp.]|nr:peptidase domain-containing ABC transporter [Bacteroides sp.]
MSRLHFYKQHDHSDCGATCLRIIFRYYGKHFSAATMQQMTACGHEGTSFFELKAAAEHFGMETCALRLTWEELKEVQKPCILHWRGKHFVVLIRIRKNLWSRKEEAVVMDPAHGRLHYSREEFLKHWLKEKEQTGHALVLTPTEAFGRLDGEEEVKLTWTDLLDQMYPHLKSLLGVFATMAIGGILGLIFPFFTQYMVDYGIGEKSLYVISLVLFAQLLLTLGQLGNDLLRGWLTLKCTSLISISFIHRFLTKLTRLPIAFFETRNAGDIMQRISDNTRIQSFVTNTIVSTGISLVFFFIYTSLILEFGFSLFGVFMAGAALYIGWTMLFLKRRREIDAKRFQHLSDNQSNLIELVNGMADIKLNNCEKPKVEQWHSIQQKIYRTNLQSRSLENIQSVGATFIDQVKNLVICYMAARLVVKGMLTLGEMFTIQYILGQMNAPLRRISTMIQEIQDAGLSMERLGDIYNREDERPTESGRLQYIPFEADIVLRNVSFRYPSSSTDILKDINVTIPHGKTTAIVGTSGCGKTTLLKVMLGYYQPTNGEVQLVRQRRQGVQVCRLQDYRLDKWREFSGVVMQDGHIFSDTITRNVTMSDLPPEEMTVELACENACIQEYIESLPLKYETKIGPDGEGLSTGQKQRILLARALYRAPYFLFLDEATSALDSQTECEIIQRIHNTYYEHTIVMVAHRLSAILHADHIIVMDQGRVAEQGTHDELMAKKGIYHQLMESQMTVTE